MTTTDFTTRIAARLAPLLMKDEQVIMAGQRHWLSYSRAISFTVLALGFGALTLYLPGVGEPGESGSGRMLALYATGVCGVLAVLALVQTAFINWTIVMAVTNRRVFLRTGFIARDIVDIPLAKLDIVNLEQGILGRIFGCGEILVRTVGEVTTRFPLIGHPTAMRNAIVQAMETAARPAPSAAAKAE